MHPSAPAADLLHRLPRSTRLRCDVAIYATAQGPVLRAGDTHHHVHLDDHDLDELLEALTHGTEPTDGLAARALASLVEAGLVDPAPPRVDLVGSGALAAGIRSALTRMGARLGQGGTNVVVADHEDGVPETDLTACWADGSRVLLSPPAVAPRHVLARRRAARAHDASDQRVRPSDASRGVRSSAVLLSGPGLELAATHVAAELLRPERPPYEAVTIDLRALTVTRHTVLPVPPAPR